MRLLPRDDANAILGGAKTISSGSAVTSEQLFRLTSLPQDRVRRTNWHYSGKDGVPGQDDDCFDLREHFQLVALVLLHFVVELVTDQVWHCFPRGQKMRDE